MFKLSPDRYRAPMCELKHSSLSRSTIIYNEKSFITSAPGVLGYLEDKRDERIQVLVSLLQGQCRTYLGLKKYRKLCEQR
jgi:hypothetical protein